ncbi:uncharacterized protein LOC129883607 [Solanum dulcamara]|uniref:uncharacterized protein LOC129883607 n=1 Tax=Solanum dulcamara TaxID=45834 RepID=UPI002485958F|nr:uncharacterized protein LOC129883607 [Solanum dulcamara]
MSDMPDFKFHPMCKALRLTHLVFADDLMIFCKVDLQSVTRVMKALKYFSSASILVAKMERSSIFLAGVDEATNNALLEKTSFVQGSFSIRYLGLPLSLKKRNKLDCNILIDKITNKINTGCSKLLSYAGRLQILNVVLFSIHNFWGAIFILPQSVLKEVDQRCRKFLYGGSEERKKVNMVAWDIVCVRKCNGGLNIKGCKNWNLASVGKLLCQLVVDKDSLWVKWVHGIYMKNDSSIWEHQYPQDCSWYWKKLNSLKDGMRSWYTQGRYNLSLGGKYSNSKSYLAILGS